MDDVLILGLTLPDFARRVAFLAIALLLAALASHALSRALRRALDATDVPSASIFVNIGRGLVWALAVLSVLQPVFGIEPTAFVTALGVTSLALSLGLQDTISNLIGGLSLMVGRVVKPGDLVGVAGFVGEVTDVSWRATTVRNRLGDEQVIPNSVLNKTALEHLTLETESLCEVSLVVAHGADLAVVEGEILDAAREMRELLNPDIPPRVFFSGTDVYGVQCSVSLHLAPGALPASTRNALVRRLAGRPWFARV